MRLDYKTMAKKSSGASAAREAARLAAAGKKRKEGDSAPVARQRRLIGFTGIVVLIVILGVGLVVFARIGRDVSARPRQNEDHWHSAYGVWDCAGNGGLGEFLPAFQSTNDPVGIHSHQDGVIHVHPWYERASSKNAKLLHFYEAMGIEVTEEAIVLDNGRRLEAGVECDGKPSIITVHRWRDINSLNRDSVVYEEDLGDIRFLQQGEAFVIARAPDGADVPTPPQLHIDATFGATPGLQSRVPDDVDLDNG